jgi:hypothetical protein
VARWGGDEFAVLVEGTGSADEVVDIAERLARGVASPAFRAADTDVSLTASVGVALADSSQAGQVWRRADMAMSRAKERGGARVEISPAPAVPAPAGPVLAGPEPAGPEPAGPEPAGGQDTPPGDPGASGPAGSVTGTGPGGESATGTASGVPGAAQAAAC